MTTPEVLKPEVSVNNKPRYLGITAVGDMPLQIGKLHNCVFNPSVTLNSRRFYFIHVVRRNPYTPPPGFYDVKELGFITWIKTFKFVQVSNPHEFDEWSDEAQKVVRVKEWAFIFEAFEGDAPKGTIITAV
jgi:hypothetical protein